MSDNNKQAMTKEDASRIQATQATGGKETGRGSFAAKAQSAGNKNEGGNALVLGGVGAGQGKSGGEGGEKDGKQA